MSTTDRSTGVGVADAQTMELREEELRVHTEPVETGQVSLRTEIVSEQRTLEVPVRREEVYVERRAVDRQPADRPIEADMDQVIDVPVREERVELSKRPVVYEEVDVAKRQVTRTEHVSETVGREEARILRERDVDMAAGAEDRTRDAVRDTREESA